MPLNPQQKQQLYIYWRAGKTYTQIARLLGVTRNVIAGHCARHNLRRKVPACPDILVGSCPKPFQME